MARSSKPDAPGAETPDKPPKRASGGQPGAMNAFRTSVWAQLFTPEEVEFAEQHAWNDLSAEIDIVRIRLRRMLVAEARQLTHDGQMTTQELDEIVTEVYKTKTGKQFGNLMERKKFKRTDFTHQFNNLTARLESLVRTHHEINKLAEPNPEGETPIGTIRVEVVGAKLVEPQPENPDGPAAEADA